MLPYLNSYAAMMPVIQARESLVRILEIAVGSGNLKKGRAQQIIAQLRREARRFSVRKKAVKPVTKKQHTMILASMGIPIEEVK